MTEHLDPRVVSAVERCIGDGSLRPGQMALAVLLPSGGGQVTVVVARDLRPAVVGPALAAAFPSAMLDAGWVGRAPDAPSIHPERAASGLPRVRSVECDAHRSIASNPNPPQGSHDGGEAARGRPESADRGDHVGSGRVTKSVPASVSPMPDPPHAGGGDAGSRAAAPAPAAADGRGSGPNGGLP